MSEFFESSAFLGVTVSLLSYAFGSFLKKKFKTVFLILFLFLLLLLLYFFCTVILIMILIMTVLNT